MVGAILVTCEIDSTLSLLVSQNSLYLLLATIRVHPTAG